MNSNCNSNNNNKNINNGNNNNNNITSLILTYCLRLNPGAQGEHLAIQPSLIAP